MHMWAHTHTDTIHRKTHKYARIYAQECAYMPTHVHAHACTNMNTHTTHMNTCIEHAYNMHGNTQYTYMNLHAYLCKVHTTAHMNTHM